MKSPREYILKQAEQELIENYLEKHYEWDRHFGSSAKPFHRNECLCDACLMWIIQNARK